MLARREDLFDDHIGLAALSGCFEAGDQIAAVSGRIGQAVHVIDPHAVD